MTGGNMEVMYGIFLQDTSRRMTSDCGAPFSLRVARASAGVLHHLGAGITKRRLGGKNHPLQFGQQPCVSQVRFGRFARHLSHRVKALLVAFTQPVIKDRGNLQVLKPCYSASFPQEPLSHAWVGRDRGVERLQVWKLIIVHCAS